ncbi:MAG: hypothetical protein H8F28_14085 [Fibrella sp.]|nr:hypothetical protein [Armatimonadota bacterium]
MFIAVHLLAGVSLVGCGGSNTSIASESRLTTTSPRQEGNLSFTLSTPQNVYKRGEDIPFTLTVRNTGDRPVSVYFRNFHDAEPGLYDAKGKGGSYQLHSGMVVERVVTYAPGESKQYPLDYQQSISEPKYRLPKGRYQLAGWLVGSLSGYDHYGFDPTPLASGRLSIEITD